MTYSFDGHNYVLRLEKGEILSATLIQFVNDVKIEGAWLNGLGAASNVELGFFNLKSKEYKWKTFDAMMEVAALTGNLAHDESGKIMFHLHGVFADEEYRTVGGHVKDLTAGATLELFVNVLHQPLHRKLDDSTGLQLLNLS